MKNCPYCGAECKDGATICPRCGKKLIQQPVLRKVETPPPPPPEPVQSPLSRSSHLALGLVIGGVLSTLIVLIAILMATRPATTPAAPAAPTQTSAADTYVVPSGETSVVSGTVSEAVDGVTPLANASVGVYQAGQPVANQSSGADGGFEFELDPGEYTLQVTAPGHVDFTSSLTVYPQEHTYLETVLMVEGAETDEGDASGTIVDTVSGQPMEGVQLTFNPGWNNFDGQSGSLWGSSLATTVTDGSGHYEVHLPLGYYTVVVTYDQYLASSFNIVIQKGETDNQNGTITPVVSGGAGDGYLVTLTWGVNPNDLDSHVRGTLTSGEGFHVYYISKNCSDGDTTVCSLDYDDTDSYGPEHITLKPTTSSPYYYYVYRFAGSGTVASSGAKVTVHRGNTLVREFNVPSNQGSGDYWNVFAIVNNQIIVRDTITDAAELDYVQ